MAQDALFRRDGKPYAQRRTVRVELGRRSAWFTGGRVVIQAIKAVGAPCMRALPEHRPAEWTVPLDWVSDVLAELEHVRRRVVDVSEVDR